MDDHEQHEPRTVSVNAAAAIALVAVCAGMLLGYEVARLDHDAQLSELWKREPKEAE